MSATTTQSSDTTPHWHRTGGPTIPNDYDALLGVIDQGSLLAGGDVYTTLDMIGATDFAAANIAMFAAVPPAPPVLTPENYSTMCWATALLGAPGAFNSIFTPVTLAGAFMGVKVVYVYAVNGQSFSELWYQNVADASAPTLPGIVGYVSRRLAFSGSQTVFQRVRISTIGSRFSNRVYSAQQLQQNGLGSASGSVQPNGALGSTETDAADVTLLVNCSSGIRSRRIFVRGIPDFIVQNGGQYVPSAYFTSAFNSWVTWVTGSSTPYGWFGQPANPTRIQITNIIPAGGQLAFTLAGAGLFGAGPNYANVPVRIRGLPHPWAYLNGALTVLPNSSVACTGIRAYPVPSSTPPTLPVTSQMYLQNPGVWYPCTSAGVEGITSRKAGRLFGVPRGRRANRQWS
jgi:hypothetical protein